MVSWNWFLAIMLVHGAALGQDVAPERNGRDCVAEVWRIAEANAPRGENGWAAALRAAEIVRDQVPENGDSRPSDYFARSEWLRDDAKRARFRETLEVLREAGYFVAMAEAARAECFVAPIERETDPPLLSVPGVAHIVDLEGIDLIRKAGSTSNSMMLLGEEEHNAALALDGLSHGLTLIRAADSRPMILHRLTANSIARSVLDGLRLSLVRDAWPGEVCRSMLREVDRRLPLPGLVPMLEAEKAHLLCVIEDLYDLQRPENVLKSGLKEASNAEEMLEVLMEAFGLTPLIDMEEEPWPAREETLALLGGYYDRVIADAARRRWERTTVPLDAESLGGMEMLASDVPRKMLGMHDEHLMLVHGVRLMLALRICRDVRGAYPESLRALVPEFMAALPTDPFTPDGRFRYRRNGDSYVLYTVGYDGVDDGGKRHQEWNDQALKDYGAGLDFVLSEDDGRK